MPSDKNSIGNLEVQNQTVDANFLAALNDRMRRIGSAINTAVSGSTGPAGPAGPPGPAGSVVSVGLTAPSEFTVSGSPITGSGTLALTKATQSPNFVYAGPASGSAGAPTFRALVAADIPGGGGGGGGGTNGTATLNFGPAPGTNRLSVAVTGQTGILSTSTVNCFMMADSTSDHNTEEHLLIPINLRANTIVAGAGFTVQAFTEWRLTGTFKIRWNWS